MFLRIYLKAKHFINENVNALKESKGLSKLFQDDIVEYRGNELPTITYFKPVKDDRTMP